MKRALLVWLGLLFGAAAIAAQAHPLGTPPVPELVEASDLIVVGEAVRPDTTDPVADFDTPFDVRVTRTLKGPSGLERVAVVQENPNNDDMILYNHVQNGEFGIFFLRLDGDGPFVMAVPYFPDLPATRFGPPRASAPSDALEAVVREIVWNFVVPADHLRPAERWLATRIGSLCPDEDSDEDCEYLAASSSMASIDVKIRSAMITNALPYAKGSLARLWIFAFLLNNADFSDLAKNWPSAVEEISRALLHPDSVPSDLVRELAGAIASDVHPMSATDIPLLASFLRSPDGSVREGAAEALRQVGTRAAVLSLLDILDDPYSEVRIQAVAGLCEASNVCHCCDVERYARPENRAAFLAVLRNSAWFRESSDPDAAH